MKVIFKKARVHNRAGGYLLLNSENPKGKTLGWVRKIKDVDPSVKCSGPFGPKQKMITVFLAKIEGGKFSHDGATGLPVKIKGLSPYKTFRSVQDMKTFVTNYFN